MRAWLLALMMLSMTLTGCIGGDDAEEELMAMPSFSSVADNGQTYDNEAMAGSGYIVVFSAEWCSSPCHTTMHAIWDVKPELTVLVMSTDPSERPNGITLNDWHDAADAHDDEGDDLGVNLSTYAFMKGSEAAAEIGIETPGSVAFVNAEGYIVYLHNGRLNDVSIIAEQLEAIGL